MATYPIVYPLSLRIDALLFRRLCTHLFPGDGDEHGAVVAAGIATSSRGTRLLARKLFLAQDGVDYVPGSYGYRALSPEFVANVSHYCAEEDLCYLAVHCHNGTNSVGFSSIDMASHERGYPALLDITGGWPVGALVFASNAIAGDIWTPQGRHELNHATVIGSEIRRLYPKPLANPRPANPIYDRHTRLFGDIGQEILLNLKVGIIGLGGGGSLINEWISRLGVGNIVAVDFDRLDPTNLPRIVGSTHWDALTFLHRKDGHWLEKIRQRFARHKVFVAERVARQANPKINFNAIVGDVMDRSVANQLTDVDFLFLASDTMQSRLVFNALVHQYLIPGVQIGAKVTPDNSKTRIEDIFTATRPVLPFPGGGCLDCHGLISATRLREEALDADERRRQQYVDSEEVAAPSVITLNVASAAQAVNDFMMMFTGLYDSDVNLIHQLNFIQQRLLRNVEPRCNDSCFDCSIDFSKSRRARGDRYRLPCREL